jgi:hypothetical protein
MGVANLSLSPQLLVPVKRPSKYSYLYLPIDEGTGTKVYDKSRYNAYGDITGAAWADGNKGKCLDFDQATPSYVEIPAYHTQLNFTSEDFSFVVRLKFDTFTNNPVPFSRGIFNSEGYYFQVNTLGQASLYTNQAGGWQRSRSASGELVLATWYTLGVSRSGSAVKIYKNGVDVTSIVGTHINPLSSTQLFLIGIEYNKLASPFDGKVEFLAVLGNVALTANQHLAWHNRLAEVN